MKLLFTLTIIVLTLVCYGQPLKRNDSLVNRLYNEITNAPYIEGKYIGCYGTLSVLYKKVDSLRDELGIKTFAQYFEVKSINLKYYAFMDLLILNNAEDVFEKLKQVDTTSKIDFEFAGQNDGKVKLIELLVSEYLGFIKMKYYYGVGCTCHNRTYLFTGKNRKIWRQKYKLVQKFIVDNKLSQKWIESYSCK